MTGIVALAIKDLRLLFRNKGHLFFSFLWPLIVALFFGLLFAGPEEGASAIRVAVVDEDASENSRALVDRLAKTAGLTVEPATRAAALDAVRRGRQVGAIIVPKGYGQASQRMFYGDPPRIELATDPSRRAESAMLEGMLMGAAMEGMQRLFTDADYSKRMVDEALSDLRQDTTPEMAGKADLQRFLGELRGFLNSPASKPEPAPGDGAGGGTGWQPLVVQKTDIRRQYHGPRNAFMVTFPQGVLWGMIGCAFGFAMSLVIERTRGTLTRLQMSPLSRGHVLAGKALACFISILIVELLLFGIARVFLGVVPGSLPLLALAGLCLAVGFVGIMMLISVLGKTEQTVAGLGWALLLPLSMVGGGMVPLFVMPGWMQTVSNVSPIKWGILALEGALWRGFTPAEMALPCLALIAVGVVGFLVGARVFKSA